MMPSTQTSVSVIVPVRNAEDSLHRCVQSVLNQTYSDFELIIIDDGSTDGTALIAREFNDPRIVWVTNTTNVGIVPTLNRGIKLARGRYIARLDSDDWAHPERLALQVAVLEANPRIGLVGSWMKTFGETTRSARYPVNDSDIRLWMLFGTPFGHPSVMFRREWSRGNEGYYDQSFEFAEDFELWTRISSTWETYNIPQFLTHYRTHSSQLTKHNLRERAICTRRIIETHHRRIDLEVHPDGSSVRDFLKWWSYLESSEYGKTALKGAGYKFVRRRQIMRLMREKFFEKIKN